MGAQSHHMGTLAAKAKVGKYFVKLKEITLAVPNLAAATAKIGYDFVGCLKKKFLY